MASPLPYQFLQRAFHFAQCVRGLFSSS
jgi:hypothetical protein